MKKLLIPIFALVVSSAFVLEGDVLAQLRERSTVFFRKFNRSKLDLYFNQPRYSAGDTAHVRTLYLSAADLKPVEGKQIVYLELYDNNGVPALQDQLIVINGQAATDFIIPQKFGAGIYQLVAYTDWMRNFDASLFFRQDFIVTGQELLDQVKNTAREGALDFFPEGGSLILGVENNVLLHVNGDAAANKQISISAGGDVIATVVTDADGMAELKFVPKGELKYTAAYSANGQSRTIDLPPAKSQGFAMTLTSMPGANSLRVKLQAGPATDRSKKYFLVVINSRGVIYSKVLESLKDEGAEYTLPEELPSGVADLIIVDEALTRLAERALYIKEKTSYSVSIKSSKAVYGTREEAQVDVEVIDKTGNLVDGQFTTRIIKKDIFPDADSHESTAANLHLYSDIAPTFKLKQSLIPGVANRYLIGQTCPWLSWDKLILDSPVAPQFAPQSNITLSGKAVSLENGESVRDSTQIMFFLQKQVFGYEVYTNKAGEFKCPILFDFTGTDQVFFTAMNHGKDLPGIAIKFDEKEQGYSFKAAPWRTIAKEQDPYGSYDFRKSIIDKSYSYFLKKKSAGDSIANPNAQIEDELQGADITFKSNDYIIFPTMPDLVREVLRSVDYRYIHGRDIVRIYTTGKRPTNSASPLYVIDGIMSKNTATFIGLKPSDILSIKVIKDSNKLMKFGTLGVNGVILVTTKFAGRKPAINAENVFPLIGLSPKTPPFASAKTTAPNIPDLRPCILWAPQHPLNSEGKAAIPFTTSDDVGTFVIEVRGTTKAGIPFSGEQTVDVRFPAN